MRGPWDVSSHQMSSPKGDILIHCLANKSYTYVSPCGMGQFVCKLSPRSQQRVLDEKGWIYSIVFSLLLVAVLPQEFTYMLALFLSSMELKTYPSSLSRTTYILLTSTSCNDLTQLVSSDV